MVDIERLVASRLASKLGVPAYVEVPDPRPDEFVSVELTGGGEGDVCDPNVTVQAWAATRIRARELIRLAALALVDMTDETEVFGANVTDGYRYPDPDSRQARYQLIATIYTCE